MKAFKSKSGTTWECEVGEFESKIFLVLDGHVDHVVDRCVKPKKRGEKRRMESIVMPFRYYLDLDTGEFSHFSEDSWMNSKAKRVK